MCTRTPQVWILRYTHIDLAIHEVLKALVLLRSTEGRTVLHTTAVDYSLPDALQECITERDKPQTYYRVIYSSDYPEDESWFDKELEWPNRDSVWAYARKLADEHNGCAVQEISFNPA